MDSCNQLSNFSDSTAVSLPVTPTLDSVFLDRPVWLFKRNQLFSTVPLRRSDILQQQGPRPSLFVPYEYQLEDGLFRVLLLAKQLSPPKSLILGNYQWSILRFVVCSIEENCFKPCGSFDVKVPDVDVGRQGPFSTVLINSNRTTVACFSSRHNSCVLFHLPVLSDQSQPIAGSSIALPFKDSVIKVCWHPSFPSVLVVISESLLVVVDTSDISAAAPRLRCISVSDVADVVVITSLDSAEVCDKSSAPFHPIFLLVLKCNGSVHLMVVPSFGVQLVESSVAPSPSENAMQKVTAYAVEPHDAQLVRPADSNRAFVCSTELLREGTSESFYTSLAVLRHELIFVICRITAAGHLEVHGIDTPFNSLERSNLLSGVPQRVSSTCLDEKDLPISSGAIPTLHSGPPCNAIKHDVASFCACPFLTVLAAQELIVVEFPWLTQIEASAFNSLNSPPSLIPTNVQPIFVVDALAHYNQDEDYLHLGCLVIPAGAMDLAPRVLLLRTTMEPVEPLQIPRGYTANVQQDETGWDICDEWTFLSIPLFTRLTANKMLSSFRDLFTEAWEFLSPESNPLVCRKGQYTARSKTSDMSCKTLVESLRKELDNLVPNNPQTTTTLRAAPFSKSRDFTFSISPEEPVGDILAKLGVSSLKLWKVQTFQAQLKRVQKEVCNLDVFGKLASIQQTNCKLEKEAERLHRRIETIKEKHMFLINSLRALLSSRIAPLLDNSRLALIRQHVVPLLKRLSYPAVSLFNHVLRSHSEGITSSITEQLLLQSIVRASTTLSSRTAAESELLRQKVRIKAARVLPPAGAASSPPSSSSHLAPDVAARQGHDSLPRYSSTGRDNCAYLFEKEFKWNDRGNVCQLAFYTFLSLPRKQKNVINLRHFATQKRLMSTFETLQNWQDFHISHTEIGSIATCDIDIKTGRTLGMQMIRMGFTSSINSPFAQTYIFTRESLKLKDARNNTVLHLAVKSGDVSTVDAVIRLLYLRTNIKHSELQALFQEKNADGKLPIQLLFSNSSRAQGPIMHNLPMLSKLKSYYENIASFSHLKQLGKRQYGRLKVLVNQP